MKFMVFGLGGAIDGFLENMGLLLSSGVPMNNALKTNIKVSNSRRLKYLLENLLLDIEAGIGLAVALERLAIVRDGHVLALIKSGEASGRLSEHLRIISEEKSKQRLFKSRVYSAMIYPVFVLIIAFVATIAILWFIVPRLSNVLLSLGADIPWFTRQLISASQFLRNLSLSDMWTVGGLGAILLIIYFLLRYFNYWLQWLVLHTPIIKKLIQEAELARFGYLSGLLLDAGLIVPEVITAIGSSAVFSPYRFWYKEINNLLLDGLTMEDAFQETKETDWLLPISVQQIIVSGEQSGRLTESLKGIGDTFESRAEITAKNLSAIIEPLLLILVWLAVVGVALSVIVPLYSSMGGFSI